MQALSLCEKLQKVFQFYFKSTGRAVDIRYQLDVEP